MIEDEEEDYYHDQLYRALSNTWLAKMEEATSELKYHWLVMMGELVAALSAAAVGAAGIAARIARRTKRTRRLGTK